MSICLNFNDYPIIERLKEQREILWINENYISNSLGTRDISIEDIVEADNRLRRFSNFFKASFKDAKKTDGIIESQLMEIENFRAELFDFLAPHSLFLKCDNLLPIAGSIKARGGIYEVIKHAEDLALENSLMTIDDDYSILTSEKFKNFFSKFSITVGSTGNLGLSIGMISSKIGFNVFVHMSSDAKEWKKNMLRENGVNVVEHNTDYTLAVEKGRKEAMKDPNNYFVDDENSKNLFLGYAVSALRLKEQLIEKGIEVTSTKPLIVYIPCGVGGGPGGVLYGLKKVFGENIHCFFAEPIQSPCMLLGMATNLHDKISVQDIGLTNMTEADGLAVGKASAFVGKTIQNMLAGVGTVEDDNLFKNLAIMIDKESIRLEPSAVAGGSVIEKVFEGADNLKFIDRDTFLNSTHIVWATGGSLVPDKIMNDYYKKGKALL